MGRTNRWNVLDNLEIQNSTMSSVAARIYEAWPTSIRPFWITREPVTWPWCNMAASQRRPYCASVSSHCPMGLVSRQWDNRRQVRWSAPRSGRTLPPCKDPVPIVQEPGWTPGPVCRSGISRPQRDSIPDGPARSQSLYQLNYRAQTNDFNILKCKRLASEKIYLWI